MMKSVFRSWRLFLVARWCATLCGALVGAVIGLEKTNQVNFVGAGIGALAGCFLMFVPLWICGAIIIAYFAIFMVGQEQKRLEMDQPGSEALYGQWALYLLLVLSMVAALFLAPPVYLALRNHPYTVGKMIPFLGMLAIAVGFSLLEAFKNYAEAKAMRGKLRILFLRPFWADDRLSAAHLNALQKSIEPVGRLVVFEKPNSHERQYLQVSNGSRDFQGIELLRAESANWQSQLIEQIQKADAIVVELAPKDPNTVAFAPIKPSLEPQFGQYSEPELGMVNKNPVQEVGTGAGLLRELDYCQQAGALGKVIVLIPLDFYPRILDALKTIETYSGIHVYKNAGSGLVIPLTPEISIRDQALRHLKSAYGVIAYANFGDPVFTVHILSAALDLLKASPASPKNDSAPNKPLAGIPDKPLALPPDGELKNIRFTPLHRITRMPKGEIVELSLDEVKQTEAGQTMNFEGLACPQCGQGMKTMFWYQYSRQPSQSEAVYMRCQYCGHDDYI